MPKIKAPARSPHIDMTPMVDLFSLLLTFFMLTTSFRPQEPALVDTPSSISEKQAQDKNIMTIMVDSIGRVYFNIDNGKDTTNHTRANILQAMGIEYKIKPPFTPEELKTFSRLGSFGTSIDSIRGWIAPEKWPRSKTHPGIYKRDEFQKAGIPMKDSANYEFRYWIRNARKYNPDAEVAIKGDAGTDYKVIKKIMDILQENNVNKFNLITNLQKQEVKLSDIPANPTK